MAWTRSWLQEYRQGLLKVLPDTPDEQVVALKYKAVAVGEFVHALAAAINGGKVAQQVLDADKGGE